MSDIKVEGHEPDAAPATTNDQAIPELMTQEPIKEEKIETAEAEIKEEKSNAESKEEKAVPDVKQEIKEEKPSVEGVTDAQKANPTLKNGHVKKEYIKKEFKDENGNRIYENGVLKTSAQVNPDLKNNSKYDASVLPASDDAGLIRGQVEFYFGDSNLPFDKFLLASTEGKENKPVPIATVHKFKRMQRFQPYSLVVSALRESKFLVVEGEEGQETVKRKIAYDPNAPRTKVEARSVYVKGFGDEEPSSQFDIEAFFTPFGPLNSVRLRRTDEKLFKGSVYVEFADEKVAEAFLAVEPKPLWKGKHILVIKSKTEYINEKSQEIRDGKKEPAQFKGGRGGGFRGRGNGRGRGRGDFKGRDGDRDPNDWKKRREEDKASGFKHGRGGNRGGDRKHHDRKGGNRGRRDDRGPRTNDRNRERGDKEKNGDNEGARVEKGEAVPENEKKRSREDDNGADEHQSKKIDIKPEVATEA